MSIGEIKINSLKDFEIIGGSSEVLEIEMNYTDGTPWSLDGATVKLDIARIGDSMNLIASVVGDISDGNKCVFTISGDITSNLYGKYIYQPVISFINKEYRVAQGTFTVIPKIQSINSINLMRI